jgi:hypothetical protein
VPAVLVTYAARMRASMTDASFLGGVAHVTSRRSDRTAYGWRTNETDRHKPGSTCRAVRKWIRAGGWLIRENMLSGEI